MLLFGIFRFVLFRFAYKIFHFASKQNKQNKPFFFAISLRSYSLPFRFFSHRSEIRGHPNRHVFIIFPGIYPDQLKYRFSAVPNKYRQVQRCPKQYKDKFSAVLNNLTSRYLIVRDKFAFV